MKTYEYFFLGKPVISTPILESVRLGKFVSVANDVGGFKRDITGFLKKPLSLEAVKARRRLCSENSWNRKVGAILSKISGQ